MSFPYKLAAVDLDGTLLGPDHAVSPVNVEALARLQGEGVQIVIASGRRYQNSVRLHRELKLTGPIISCQGALVIEPETGEVFEEHPLSPALAAQMVTDGEAAGFSVVYYHRRHLYAAQRNAWIRLYESRIGELTELRPDLSSLAGADALKIVWYGEPAALLAARPGLEAKYRGQVDVLSTDPENLEFMTPGIDKGTGLQAIVRHYDLPLAETLAFGDGENDVPMFRKAGLGVAMDGGSPLARSAAGLVGSAGSPESSFARAVEAVFKKVHAL